MIGTKDTMRNDAPANYTYQDRVFENEMNRAIWLTDQHYENMLFREGIKTGFYDLQVGLGGGEGQRLALLDFILCDTWCDRLPGIATVTFQPLGMG